MTRRTGGRRRDVYIEDERRDAVELDGDADGFDEGVVDEGAVDFGEWERVVDEEGHTTPTPIRTVTMEKRVSGDVDVEGRSKFGLLDGGDSDAMFVEEFSKFICFTEDAITVPLEDGWSRRRDGARAWVWVNPSDDEEACEEDEEAEREAEDREREASRRSATECWPTPSP